VNWDTHHREVIDRILPYRLTAVSLLNLALAYRALWKEPATMEIYFNGQLSIEGRSTGFINPTIEAGLVHCRALLEFIGLAVRSTDSTELVPLARRRGDDLGIEHFSHATGPLARVTPAEAVARYAGDPAEARRALAYVIHIVNKGLAHSTVGLITADDDFRLIEIASRGVPAILLNHFYKPLGIQPPTIPVTSRPRPQAE
jgi:hypothetical protein